jgi:hypothetical protein
MLFISYSRKNVDLADQLVAALDKTDHEYWIDRVIGVGEVWSVEVETAIKQARAVVVIVTNAAVNKDSFVRKELHYAYSLQKQIYLLFAEDVPAGDIPIQVADLHRIQGFGNFDQCIKDLLLAISPLETGTCDVEGDEKLLRELSQDDHAMMTRFSNAKLIYIKEEITKGKSGSKVFFVDAAFRNNNKRSPHFLKINRAQNDQPRKRFEMAHRTSMGRFMPKLSDATPWDESTKRIGLLYGLSDSTKALTALDDLLERELGQASELINKVCEALIDWNDGGQTQKTLYAPNLLAQALYDSTDPDSRYRRLEDPTSSIQSRIESLLEINPTDLLIDFETRHGLPNPLAFLVQEELWRGSNRTGGLQITYPTGHIHGDLNVRNILAIFTTRDRKSLSLSLIDFDTYDPNNLILIDFAFLEIAIIMRLCNPEKPENQHELERFSGYLAREIELSDGIPDLNVISVGANILLRPLRAAVAQICDVYKSDYGPAFWIARVAAGLEMARKTRTTRQERVLAMLIAADSMQSLIDELGLKMPRMPVGKSPFALKWVEPPKPEPAQSE